MVLPATVLSGSVTPQPPTTAEHTTTWLVVPSHTVPGSTPVSIVALFWRFWFLPSGWAVPFFACCAAPTSTRHLPPPSRACARRRWRTTHRFYYYGLLAVRRAFPLLRFGCTCGFFWFDAHIYHHTAWFCLPHLRSHCLPPPVPFNTAFGSFFYYPFCVLVRTLPLVAEGILRLYYACLPPRHHGGICGSWVFVVMHYTLLRWLTGFYCLITCLPRFLYTRLLVLYLPRRSTFPTTTTMPVPCWFAPFRL